MREFEEQVKAGFLWMDEHFPDWREKMDEGKDRFAINEPCHCVFGLVNGDYYVTKDMMSLSDGDAQRLGFEGPIVFGDTDAWERLEAEWRFQLWGETNEKI